MNSYSHFSNFEQVTTILKILKYGPDNPLNYGIETISIRTPIAGILRF